MTEISNQRREWELRFPGLDDEWTHWWMEGDGALLAIVGGADLTAALDIVEKHFGQCAKIIVYLAQLDSFGEVVRDKAHRWEIASRPGPGGPMTRLRGR